MNRIDGTRAYPLTWPSGWPRMAAQERKDARFDNYTIDYGRRHLENEVRLFGGTDLIISSNLELKMDGTPRSVQSQPADRGVAIYFKREHKEVAMACDVYRTVQDNLWALVRTIQALRQIERDGSPTLINAAFTGFLALPDPTTRPWWETLGCGRSTPSNLVQAAYRFKAHQYHPDHNPDDEVAAQNFLDVQAAWEAFKKERGL